MIKIAVLLSLCISSSFATRFLFGVEVKCELDQVFQFTVSHMEEDTSFFCNTKCPFDDVVAPEKTFLARKSLFFYHDGAARDDGHIDLNGMFENYGIFVHNCSSTGETLEYRHNLWKTPTSHGSVHFLTRDDNLKV